jgi:tetratricopeptide (TPR) repeat protein
MAMQGPIRSLRVTLTFFGLACWLGIGLRPATAIGPPIATGEAQAAGGKDGKGGEDAKPRAAPAQRENGIELSDFFAQPGDDPPRAFVPLRPSTTDDRRRLDVVRLYSAGRALEDRRAWTDAVAVFQEALKLEPDSIAVARRLSRIYIGALGKPELAIEYGKRVLAAEPGDSETLSQLVEYYRKNDPPGAEVLLNGVLANPKLDQHAPARLLAQFELGRLYSGRLHQTEKAADAFAKVLEGLDDKSANRLTPTDQFRILGNNPAMAYFNFGMVFLAAKRNELAVKALEHGMVYDEDNTQISLLLADTLLKLNRGEQALALVDRHIERQTPFVEAYELLARVLKSLNREKEITPRLEAAARRDAKNVPLQYVLADRYRETGENDKAEALYKELLTSRPTPQTYRALASSLLKRKKAADFLKVVSEALDRPETRDAITSQLGAAAADDEMADDMLESALKQIASRPGALSKTAYTVVYFIANNSGAGLENRARRLEKLLSIQRYYAEQNPGPLTSREVADTLMRLGKYAESASTIEKLIARYSNEKSVSLLVLLADLHRRSGHNEAVKATLREAMRLGPSDNAAQSNLASVLGEVGQVDDAVRVAQEMVTREPGNPETEFFLGTLLARFERNEEAIKVFNGMLKRYPDDDKVVKTARPMLSVIYVNQGDYAKGEAELERLLERFPDDPGCNNDLGYLYADQGKNLEKAEVMIRKALLEKSDEKAYLDSLGWVLFKRGKVKEALEPLEKAAEKMREGIAEGVGSPDSTILEHLGDVYFQLHDLRKAGDSWREAAKFAEQAVPVERRLPEIRKKIGSLEKLGPIPKSPSTRTP